MQTENKVKLVIWDLDDTFWHGTIAEEKITINLNALEVVKTLNKRGIINTIVSKNSYEVVKKKLLSEGYWDLFIMPSISYEPKGERIKSLIKKFNLRTSNVMFIDDNNNNLMEAKYYNPELTIVPETEINNLLNYPELKGKNDINFSRFKQYKHLENVLDNKKNFETNIDFTSISN